MVTSKEGSKKNKKAMIGLRFAMKIIIVICWSIWSERNSWIFNNLDLSVLNCRNTFRREFLLVILRANQHNVDAMITSRGCWGSPRCSSPAGITRVEIGVDL
jgi:hypothetical protein